MRTDLNKSLLLTLAPVTGQNKLTGDDFMKYLPPFYINKREAARYQQAIM